MDETKSRVLRSAAMIFALLFAQAASALAGPPDVQLRVHATAKSITVQQKGTAYLRVTAEPDAGNVVNVSAPAVAETAHDVTVDIDAQARIAQPAAPTNAPPR